MQVYAHKNTVCKLCFGPAKSGGFRLDFRYLERKTAPVWKHGEAPCVRYW